MFKDKPIILRDSYTNKLKLSRRIQVNTSKNNRRVKVNAGQSLDYIAHVFMGDCNKWREIALLNNLKDFIIPPHIDYLLLPLEQDSIKYKTE